MSLVFATPESTKCAAHWRVVCDRPDCNAFIVSPLGQGSDREHMRSARVSADANGWDIARHCDVPFDFCPEHVNPANKLPITQLYDAAGMPLNKHIPTTDGQGNSLRSKR